MFMGDEGTIKMSEDPVSSAIYREARAPSWDDLVAEKLSPRQGRRHRADADADKVDVRETAQLAEYEIPRVLQQSHRTCRTWKIFSTPFRGTAKLNCPADEAFRSEYFIHKANEAIAAQKRIAITAEETEA